MVAVPARVQGKAVAFAYLPVKRQHGLPAGALAAKAADRNALAGIQVFRANLLVDVVGLRLEVERIAWIPHGEDCDLLAVVELLDAAVAAAEADGREVAPWDGLLDRHLAVHPFSGRRWMPHVYRACRYRTWSRNSRNGNTRNKNSKRLLKIVHQCPSTIFWKCECEGIILYVYIIRQPLFDSIFCYFWP